MVDSLNLVGLKLQPQQGPAATADTAAATAAEFLRELTAEQARCGNYRLVLPRRETLPAYLRFIRALDPEAAEILQSTVLEARSACSSSTASSSASSSRA